MPTRKRRIGFIPRLDILNIIDNISEEENLSNSKVVNILIEEALYTRGLIKSTEIINHNNHLEYFKKEFSELNNISYRDDSDFQNDNEDFMQSKNNNILYKRFFQFLHFKKMMRMFDKFD